MIYILVSYFIFKLFAIQYVPLWDGWANSGEVIYNATTKPFDFFNFELVGHSSFIYLFLISFLQYFNQGNIALIHLSITFLTIASIYVFYLSLILIFDIKKYKSEIYFLSLLYAFFPIILSNSLHINIDYGVMIFFIFFLYCLMSKKYLLAVISSVGMIFSKETGLGLYGISIFIYIVLNWNKRVKKWFYFVFPPVLFMLRILYIEFNNKGGLWFLTIKNSFSTGFGTPGFESDVLSRIPFAYLLGIFVINFNWILSIAILMGIGAILKNKKTVFLFAVLIFSALFLTMFKTFTNLRYFLSLYPLMIILAGAGIIFTIKKSEVRKGMLIAVSFLFFSANFYTFDPISRRIYGTFNFGKHRILKMTSVTGECCGYGRDQLVYNLETIPIHYLINKIASDLKADKNTVFAYHPAVGPEIMFNFDKNTLKRTIGRRDTFTLKTVNWNFDTLNQKPAKIYFIEFPIDDNGPEIDKYLKYYDLILVRNYSLFDFDMKVDALELKKTF